MHISLTFYRSVLGSVAEGGAMSTPGSFSDIMQLSMTSMKQVTTDETSEYITRGGFRGSQGSQ